ncbi:unnamed protein product [Parnassius apollo]|uniref:(apollo) hypothetical protein n=1 Tax=Parnassius apollo TaxID=110799 RepID=A0A8S3Y1S9_PARAO|nr:unnamed protein product [Parnassius apollo]
MDVELVKGLLETIQNAMVSNKRYVNLAVPIFDPDKSNDGAAAWCETFNKLADELKWSSFEKTAKAGKALRGSALSWFDTWENLRQVIHGKNSKKILSVYPQRKNLSEKLLSAVLYTSNSTDFMLGRN